MFRIYTVFFVLCTLFVLAVPAVSDGTDELTLEQAISLAVEKNPDLSSLSWEIRARGGRAAQAGTLPNPELSFNMDNFWGNKDLRGFDGAEYTLALTQLIELGGKRSKKASAAGIERDLAKWDYETKRLDLINEVTKAFTDVLAEQERLKVSEELFSLSEKSLNTVSARVQAGKVSPIEETKASAELSKARIELERAARSLDAARKRLSAVLGNPSLSFKKAAGQIDLALEIPVFQRVAEDINKSPDIARWLTEIEQRKAALNLELANRMPDPSISVGFKRFRETETSAMVAAISIPLPLFNRNAGAVAETQSRLSKAEHEQKAALLKAHSAMTEAYAALSSAFEEVTILKTSVLPALQTAFDAIQEGYRYGKFSYIDLLDAQRSLSESRKQLIESLAAGKKAYADIERLTGAASEQYSTGTRK